MPGDTGLTACVTLTRIARLREGEDVFVSGAAGGAGTAAGRFARLPGAAIGALRERGRVARVGTSSQYDASDAAPVSWRRSC
ncbi:hypothetical protein [Streptomyces sp. NPDC048192]|uniref:hypothetical protein n=1 Tax=unclassified Streptomyces TaxID=2593676 RepID=UPI003719E4DB